MLDTMISGNNFPLQTESALVAKFPRVEEEEYSGHIGRPYVKAATELKSDSATEVIDIDCLAHNENPLYEKIVEITAREGRLHCINDFVNTSCWLKMVPLAKDCQSPNVMLMNAERGVVLKTIKNIYPGEPLLMWFTENILAMMNIPFLTPRNILGKNRYTCEMCNFAFECPNPLKIHLALKCNRLDLSYLWTKLAKEYNAPQKASLILNPFTPIIPFKFQLSGTPKTNYNELFASRTSPETIVKSGGSLHSSASSSSAQSSPESVINERRPPSSMDISQVKKNLTNHHSAFKPYQNKPMMFSGVSQMDDPLMSHYQVVPTPAPPSSLSPGVHAAQLETICSNLGKLKQGHKCIYCGKIYSRKYGLKIHIRTHTGYKPLNCKYCLRPFGDPSNLNKHVRLHADTERNSPYRCDICGKNLVRRRDLDRHIRSRHQENSGNSSDASEDLDISG
ncbi:zinc finger protein 728-like [Leptopilina boulardi]|uniref:zinc finger protein 728-like n=1 Tax=Leptopilina boulardi TaxID=63433 RepID=UPI0021F54B58|nr:zinc finger protein 728-like [Leptopilina boulardi]